MRIWQDRYGRLPSSYDWSRTHALAAARKRYSDSTHGDWPPASVVCDVFGTWDAARAAAHAET